MGCAVGVCGLRVPLACAVSRRGVAFVSAVSRWGVAFVSTVSHRGVACVCSVCLCGGSGESLWEEGVAVCDCYVHEQLVFRLGFRLGLGLGFRLGVRVRGSG